jgi:uncharacterized protein
MYKSNVVREWRKTNRGNNINGSKCKGCDTLFLPSRIICANCKGEELEDYKFKGLGEIYSYSTIHYPPTSFEKETPYTVAIIKLDEGPKMTAQIVDSENIDVGMRVESCIRKVYVDGDKGIIHYGIKFRVVK